MNGQADTAPAELSISELSGLLDNPETDSEEEAGEEEQAEATADDVADDATDESENDEAAPDEQEEEKPAPVDKLTIKVKGEDGVEETLEVTPEEVANSYMRQRDYTKKTQALAERENQAVELLLQKRDEFREQYFQRAELTRAAFVQMAGIKSDDEMAQLASSDPAAWVAESQRQRQISSFINGLSAQIDGEKSAAKQAEEQASMQKRQDMFNNTWGELTKEGIDKPKLAKIYTDVASQYGVSNDELGEVYDARFVRIMRDAVAYKELMAKKPEVTKKLQEAQRMPSKQNLPAQERNVRELENKFKSGRAKLNDLAALL